jgi:hypothetical protein
MFREAWLIRREHPDEAEVPADFGILDELRGRLWTAVGGDR